MNTETNDEEVEAQEVDPVAASIAAAKEMLTHKGQTPESVGKWLHAQCPGKFESAEHAAKELT